MIPVWEWNLENLMWGVAGWDKDDMIKIEFITKDLGNDEMADVDRIEGTTNDANSTSRSQLIFPSPSFPIHQGNR